MSENRRVLCNKYGCRVVGTKFCGVCRESCYCSVECQKGDWKFHKMWCANKFPMTFLQNNEISDIRFKIMSHVDNLVSENKCANCIPVLEKFLIFLERQFGTKIPGEHYRLRYDGSWIDDMPLINLRVMLGEVCREIPDFAKALTHTVEAREMLEVRRVECDADVEFSIYQTDMIYSWIYICKNDYSKAQYYARQALVFARPYRGARRITYLYEALRRLADVLDVQDINVEAQTIAEEAYILVSEEYGPEHPDVQEAAAVLIECLIGNGDFSKADDFARINYETLVNGSNPETYILARAMRQLATIWCESPEDPTEDPEKGEEAERLARRAYEIVLSESGRHSHRTGSFLDVICNVLVKKGVLSSEVRGYFEHILRIWLMCYGSIDTATCSALHRLGDFYLHFSQLGCDGNIEFQVGTALVNMARMIELLCSKFKGVDDKDTKLVKAAALVTKVISDFLDTGDKVQLLQQVSAVTDECAKVMQ